MKELILYIHGKGGSAAECEHYKPLFPDCEVFGLDYQTFTPWETGAEIRTAVEKLKDGYESIILIANSIGAFFCMNAGIDGMLRKAYFISPIVDMEKLIGDMMLWANVSFFDVRATTEIYTDFGEDLSWDSFAEQHDAVLTVMENGEHWFHTAEQMRFLDDWIRK